jgi:acylphosphatase
LPSFRYLVSGRVQGVGFRYFARQSAARLGVAGFARNLADGSVEVIAEGEAPSLAAFEDALRQGPSFAEVRDLERVEIPARGDQGFYVR